MIQLVNPALAELTIRSLIRAYLDRLLYPATSSFVGVTSSIVCNAVTITDHILTLSLSFTLRTRKLRLLFLQCFQLLKSRYLLLFAQRSRVTSNLNQERSKPYYALISS